MKDRILRPRCFSEIKNKFNYIYLILLIYILSGCADPTQGAMNKEPYKPQLGTPDYPPTTAWPLGCNLAKVPVVYVTPVADGVLGVSIRQTDPPYDFQRIEIQGPDGLKLEDKDFITSHARVEFGLDENQVNQALTLATLKHEYYHSCTVARHIENPTELEPYIVIDTTDLEGRQLRLHASGAEILGEVDVDISQQTTHAEFSMFTDLNEVIVEALSIRDLIQSKDINVQQAEFLQWMLVEISSRGQLEKEFITALLEADQQLIDNLTEALFTSKIEDIYAILSMIIGPDKLSTLMRMLL